MNRTFWNYFFLIAMSLSLSGFAMEKAEAKFNLDIFVVVTLESFADLAPIFLLGRDNETPIILIDLDHTLIEQDGETYKLVENAAASLLVKLCEQGAIVMGLTARRPRNADRTREILSSLDIDFAKLSLLGNKTYEISKDESLIDGIFYVSKNRKVNYIKYLVSIVKESLSLKGPFYISAIDDNFEQLEAFVEYEESTSSSQSELIRVTPYYYTPRETPKKSNLHNWTEF